MKFAVDLKEYFYLFVILNKQRSDVTKYAKFQFISCVPHSGPLYPGTGAQWANFIVMNISLF